MSRIQKVSSYLLLVFNLLLIFFPLFLFSIWLFIQIPPIKALIAQGLLLNSINTPEGFINLSTPNWTLLTQALGLISNLVGMTPLFLGLLILRPIFRNYAKGQIFTLSNARHYQSLGWLFFLDAFITSPLSNTLMVLAVTLHNPPGHRFIVVELGTATLSSLFCGVLIIVISWIMREASQLKEEQQLTI